MRLRDLTTGQPAATAAEILTRADRIAFAHADRERPAGRFYRGKLTIEEVLALTAELELSPEWRTKRANLEKLPR